MSVTGYALSKICMRFQLLKYDSIREHLCKRLYGEAANVDIVAITPLIDYTSQNSVAGAEPVANPGSGGEAAENDHRVGIQNLQI